MKFAEAKSLYTLVLSTLFVAHNVIVLSEFLFFFFFVWKNYFIHTPQGEACPDILFGSHQNCKYQEHISI